MNHVNGKLWAGPFSAVALLLVAAVPAWACSNFIGTFSVTGNGGGTVTATGVDNCPTFTATPGSSGCSWTMSGTLSGSTSATSGIGGPAGTITVSTGSTAACTSPPTAPCSNPTSLPAGTYDVTYLNGPAYPDPTKPATVTYNGTAYPNNNWDLDCMLYGNPPAPAPGIGTGTQILGQVKVNGSGQISGGSASFTLPLSLANGPGTESAVCITSLNASFPNGVSYVAGEFGNEVPLNIL